MNQNQSAIDVSRVACLKPERDVGPIWLKYWLRYDTLVLTCDVFASNASLTKVVESV